MRRRLIAACALALCGCASPIKSGFVSEQWTINMEELGIYPVFPPREDIYVGDVYVTYGGADAADAAALASSATPAAGSPRPKLPTLGVYFARLDVAQKLKAQYAARPEFGGAPAASSSVFDGPAVQTRLKTVAFPYFFKATATGADIGAFVPVDGLPLKAGLSLDSIKSASVTVSAAESYALPWTDLADEVIDANGKLIVSGRYDAGAVLTRAQGLADYRPTTDGTKFVDVTVVTEVFYARSFDVTFHLASDVAASLGASLPAIPGAPVADAAASAAVDAAASSTGAKVASAKAATAAAKAASASAVADAASAAAGMAPRSAKPAAVAAATSAASASALASATAAGDAASAASAQQASYVAAAIQKQAEDARAKAAGLAPASPGVTVGFVKSQSGDVGLRSTYDHAIAIGYRGVRYRMNLADGRLVVIPVAHGEPVGGSEADTPRSSAASAPHN